MAAPRRLASLTELDTLPFDDIIDVRSPAEFAEDHVPGAINLPALSNEERARVGTIYVQEDPFKARKIGAALVARNVAAHLEGPLAGKPGGWRPLVYCWRGGQRSGSFASILSQIGWRAEVIEGGYQSYRRLVVRALYDEPITPEIILIDGGTGTAKTALLAHLKTAGAQVIDLEALAGHRGSLFGLMGAAQPAQKGFESPLAMALSRADPARPVFLEAESSKIGDIILPPSLFKAMTSARHIDITAPIPARAAHIVAAYPDLTGDLPRLLARLQDLVRYHGHEQVNDWTTLAKAEAFDALATALIKTHYDPSYARVSRRAGPPAARFDLPDLTPATLAKTAGEIRATLDPS